MLEWIFDTLGGMGAGLASAVLSMGVLFGAIFLGCKAAEVRGKSWQGWLVGVVSFLVLGAMFYPATEALTRVACKNADDFQACVDGD